MMRYVAIAVLVLLAAAGGAFYYFSGNEYVFRFSEAQLKEKLNAKLPLTRRYLHIFQVTLDNPRITLANGTRRVQAGIDVILNIRVGDDRNALGGVVDVSGGVKYVSEQGEFYLTDPIVERLSIQGIPAKHTEKVNTVLTKALSEYYADHPIYTLRATSLKRAAARLVLKDVVIENRQLVVTLGI